MKAASQYIEIDVNEIENQRGPISVISLNRSVIFGHHRLPKYIGIEEYLPREGGNVGISRENQSHRIFGSPRNGVTENQASAKASSAGIGGGIGEIEAPAQLRPRRPAIINQLGIIIIGAPSAVSAESHQRNGSHSNRHESHRKSKIEKK